ncbi:MAG: hypothetical protein OXI96_09435 [Acidimicrobiaceae bacterium]|nr:hypothetical protein [Acidimicrobiaceae bacterium]
MSVATIKTDAVTPGRDGVNVSPVVASVATIKADAVIVIIV